MGIFTFFKKKREQEAVVIPDDSIKALAEGVLFETENLFIKWGADIEKDKCFAKKEYRADRTIYQWGEKAVLQGLKLPLKTICWNHKQHGETKAFESIEFSAEGSDAEAHFKGINKHLESVLGDPNTHEDLQPADIALEWKVKAVKVTLKFYNKEQPKVHFEVGWWV